VATVTITVNAVNDGAPNAVDDTATTNEDTPVTISVLANDTDPDGTSDIQVNSVTLVSAPANGTAAVNADGSVIYTPNANYNGSDSFTYTVADSFGASSNAATVSVTIAAVNDGAPTAGDDIATTTSGVLVNIPVLTNDSDPDGVTDIQPGTVTIGGVPTNGTATAKADGTVDYVPNANFSGTDSFTYTVQDSFGAVSNPATVTVNVSAPLTGATVNYPPQIASICEATPQGVGITNIPLGATDPDGDDALLRFYLVANGAKGNAVVDVSGRFTYTPYPGARGTDSFTYKVIDQQGAEAIGAVKIIIGRARIMPLGDAVTAGSTDGTNVTSGYRQALRNLLIDKGYSVEFVGGQSIAPDRHEGHLGDRGTTARIAANIEGWLNANPADIVLLHVGTQDFVAGGDAANSDARIGDILNAIDAWSTSKGQVVTVLLAKIVDQWPASPAIATFNDLIAKRAKTGEVILVDQYNVLDYPADLADGVHPNSGGYQKMADAWRVALENGVLDKCP